MLLRLAYLGVANAFAMLRLLPMGDRDKTVEILALRHQIMVLERQLGKDRVRFTPSDRAFLAALLHRLPMDVVGTRNIIRAGHDGRALRWAHQPRCRPSLSPTSMVECCCDCST
ncbi:hypothetical protein [Streptomyces sp. ME19-01-6]|uniref:hypothetical protein n=1 Tax=Streptomyces sp. ME19-01-6 TaxID=3028686 RepID=UPI0029B47768|nr:hypothetical protein [Streptomyces sp. ME19-01-6]MDX3233950.1 hypothetical protein [Streptomyces sp. ME19-01-6]